VNYGRKGMQKERVSVLLDTNILISGLVFANGNEHRILKLIEDGTISLVLPETVMIESKEVLKEKFEGLGSLLNLFLDKLDYELVRLDDILLRIDRDSGKMRDKKDTPIFSAAALAKPNYVITGDQKLRLDLLGSPELIKSTKICSSREFLNLYLDNC
jgi:putative PIN family toxin of toxin-antitoxin system